MSSGLITPLVNHIARSTSSCRHVYLCEEPKGVRADVRESYTVPATCFTSAELDDYASTM